MTSSEFIRRLEHATFRAWPAQEEIRIDGWLVRFAGGHTGRANSVNPMGPLAGDLLGTIERCEELFRARRLRPLFRATPLLEPAELVGILRDRGYRLRSPTRVMTRDLVGRPPDPGPGDLAISGELDDAWLERIAVWTGVPPERRATLRGILEAIRPARAFATREEPEPVAAGLAVCEDDLVGLFDLVTIPERRGRGHGAALVEGLLAWAVTRGASRAYLQVEEDNEGARRLYRRLGFEDAYSYAYWVSGEPSPWQLPKPA